MSDVICADFDMMITYLVGDKASVEKINMYIKTEEMALTAVTLADLAIAIEDEGLPTRLVGSFRILPFDEKAALMARKIFLSMQESGNEKVKTAYNSAIAMSHGAYMLVRDKNKYKGVPPGLKFV
jgi:predicted nucleic acid-binding protein